MAHSEFLVSKALRDLEAIADAYLVDEDIEKAEQPKASAGRYAAGMTLPAHGLVAGRKGRKLRAEGNELAGAYLGAGLGAGASHLVGRKFGSRWGNKKTATIGGVIGAAGGMAGAGLGVHRAQAKGHYKPQNTQA